MKEVKREYVIMHQNYYIAEHEQAGLYNRVNDIKLASMFPTINNARKFVEDDMHENIKCVSIHEVKTVVTESALILIEGVYVYLKDYDKCNVCNKWFKKDELTPYQHDNGGDLELLCRKCYDEMDEVYPNVLEER
jgi:hypothetical protein